MAEPPNCKARFLARSPRSFSPAPVTPVTAETDCSAFSKFVPAAMASVKPCCINAPACAAAAPSKPPANAPLKDSPMLDDVAFACCSRELNADFALASSTSTTMLPRLLSSTAAVAFPSAAIFFSDAEKLVVSSWSSFLNTATSVSSFCVDYVILQPVLQWVGSMLTLLRLLNGANTRLPAGQRLPDRVSYAMLLLFPYPLGCHAHRQA